MICPHQKQRVVIISIVLIQSLAHDARSKNDSLSTRGRASHLTDQIKIMLARYIGNIDRSPTDASGCGMESRVIMNCLEHIPIWNYVQMLCKQGVMRICPDMPRVTRWYFRKEII